MSDDARWMAQAISEAERALGSTAPNPPVGAVIVRDGVLLGRGHTRPPGGPHAEVVALRAAAAAGADVRGATLYVTLEPCRHVGRTPPCTSALLAAGIGRVVVGVVDPNPLMEGKALDDLRTAGVGVSLGVLGGRAERLVRGFARVVRYQLPEVTLKIAASVDGRIATQAGESQWITGPEARADGHVLRAQHDAILVGIGTVIADDPRLSVRAVDGVDPVPVVLDSALRTPEDARLLAGPRRAVVICAEDAPERRLNADIVRVRRGAGGVHVGDALAALAARGLHRILVEGGGHVARSLLDARLVDTVVLYVGSLAIPGGRPWLAGPDLAALSDAARLQILQADVIGGDVRLRYEARHHLCPYEGHRELGRGV